MRTMTGGTKLYLVATPTDGSVRLEMCGPFHSSSGDEITDWSCNERRALYWTRYERTGEFPSYGRFHESFTVRLFTSNTSRFVGASGLSVLFAPNGNRLEKKLFRKLINFRSYLELPDKSHVHSFHIDFPLRICTFPSRGGLSDWRKAATWHLHRFSFRRCWFCNY